MAASKKNPVLVGIRKLIIAGKDNGEIKPIKWKVNTRVKGKDWGNSVFSAGAAIR